MKKRSIILVAVLMAVLLLFAGCGNSEKSESAKVEVKSMNHTFKYDKVPERTVALGWDSAEILTMLGLEDKVVAMAPSDYSKESVKPENYNKLKDKKMLKDGNWPGVPNLETILGERPDFVYGTAYSFNDKSCGKVEDFTNAGINIYATKGTSIKKPTMEAVYEDFTNIGKIFKVEEKAKTIVDEMKKKIKETKDKIKGVKKVNAFILEGVSDGKIQVDGGGTFSNTLLEMAGGKNIFGDLKEDFPHVSVEKIIEKNPKAIIVIEFPTKPAEEQIKMLEGIKEIQGVEAIKTKKYIIISSIQVFPGPQNVDGLRKMAEGLHPEKFK